MTVLLIALSLIYLCTADTNDKKYYDNYNDRVQTYTLDIPGKDAITIIEDKSSLHLNDKFDLSDDAEMKNLMTHIVHEVNPDKPRCYGPSCQEGFNANEGPQGDIEDYISEGVDKLKDFHDYPNERLQAIAALAAKLNNQKVKPDRYPITTSDENEDDSKVYTSWNRVKVKQHKHPYDDKDGWVTLEPVAWSTSKISKWKPNVKKNKPTYWNDDDGNKFSDDNRYSSSQSSSNTYTYPQKPIITRPGYINNKLHVPDQYESELPSRPSWTMNKPQSNIDHSLYNIHQNTNSMPSNTFNLQNSWSTDDSRRPYRPNCDKDENYPAEDTVYYGMSDSVVSDSRPFNNPYEYDALHQSTPQRRPIRRPTQVVYADLSDMEDDRESRPPHGDGQWVLLSTTKGYKKKRQRSLNVSEDRSDVPSVISHQAIGLTVLPVDGSHKNMTTSHGGLLEVEKSFETVEESKRVMDMKNDLEMSASQNKPVRRKLYKKKLVANGHNNPDSSTVFAAVGAGMVPAAMAMVVPMVLGRRRRDVYNTRIEEYLNDFLNRIQ